MPCGALHPPAGRSENRGPGDAFPSRFAPYMTQLLRVPGKFPRNFQLLLA
jgi:hypothetical protein